MLVYASKVPRGSKTVLYSVSCVDIDPELSVAHLRSSVEIELFFLGFIALDGVNCQHLVDHVLRIDEQIFDSSFGISKE